MKTLPLRYSDLLVILAKKRSAHCTTMQAVHNSSKYDEPLLRELHGGILQTR